MIKDFVISRIITRDVLTDGFQGIRNFFGFRLRGYESKLDKNINEMLVEMRLSKKVLWYKMSVNPMLKGSIMIVIYGEEKS